MARKPKQAARGIREYDFSNGIVLGYSQREHQIPEGYSPYINNFNIQHDGSMSPRQSVHVWDKRLPATEAWNTPLNRQFYMSYRPAPSDDYRVNVYSAAAASGFPSSVGFLFTPNGTQTIALGTAEIRSHTIFGLGSSFGTTVVAPYVIPATGGLSVPENPPPPDVPRTIAQPLQAIVITGSGTGAGQRTNRNLYDINGHTVAPEALSTIDQVSSGVFVRLNALTVKGRVFLIAGTRISYSAPGNVGNFTTLAGGGFIDLDTNSQSVGAFTLNDVIYIATRQELFSLSFSEDPGRDGQLRSVAKIEALGAAEYDNVGYIAVRAGLYKVIQGQLEPTFIPSTEPDLSFATYGAANTPVAFNASNQREEVPRHCSISRIGSSIILGGIGTTSIPDDLSLSNRHTFIYSTDMDAWVTWRSSSAQPAGGPDVFFNSFFNMLTPLVELPANLAQGTRRWWASCIKGRSYDTANRYRAFTVENRLETNPSQGTTAIWPRVYDSSGHETDFIQDLRAPMCDIASPWLTLDSPLTEKRLHRLWITGKFFNVALVNPPEEEASHTIVVSFFNPPDNIISVANYDFTISGPVHAFPDPFDRSPNQIALAGAARFMYLNFFFRFQADADPSSWNSLQEYMNIALDSVYIDATVYEESNKGY